MWTLQNVKCEPPNHVFTYKLFQGENVSSSKGKVVVEVKTITSNCVKEKWKIAYMCGLLKIKCPNQDKSIFVTFLGFHF
jgi:hypothetical protein